MQTVRLFTGIFLSQAHLWDLRQKALSLHGSETRLGFVMSHPAHHNIFLSQRKRRCTLETRLTPACRVTSRMLSFSIMITPSSRISPNEIISPSVRLIWDQLCCLCSHTSICRQSGTKKCLVLRAIKRLLDFESVVVCVSYKGKTLEPEPGVTLVFGAESKCLHHLLPSRRPSSI